MPRINLLPWREELRQKRKKDFLTAVAAAVIAGACLTWASKWYIGQQIDNQNARNAVLTEEIRMLDEQIDEINGLRALRERLIARMEVIQELQQSRPNVVHLFDEIVEAIPEGTHLTSVSQSNDRIELVGIANSTTRVANLMRNIESSEWLRRPELGGIQAVNNTGAVARSSQFTVRAQQTTARSTAEEGAAP